MNLGATRRYPELRGFAPFVIDPKLVMNSTALFVEMYPLITFSYTVDIFLESPYSINSNFTNMDNIHQKLQTIRRILGLVVRPRVKIACEQALRGALAARREKEGAIAFTSLKFEFHLQFPCGSPSTERSDFRQSGRSGNERECKKNIEKHAPRVMTSLLMSSLAFLSG